MIRRWKEEKKEREEKYRNIGFIGNKYVFDS
jgi:hypothetical protein